MPLYPRQSHASCRHTDAAGQRGAFYGDHYHILHFDGHGDYGYSQDGGGMGGEAPVPFQYRLPHGLLAFEDDDGKPDLVPADTLGVG